MQAAYAKAGLTRPKRTALLAGNCALSWCAGVAASASGMSVTWLHPAGSLADQLYQIEDAEADALIVDTVHFAVRGEELAAGVPAHVQTFRIGPGRFGTDLSAAADAAGSVSPRDLAHPTDIAVLNYTGGTTGKPKGAMRRLLRSPPTPRPYSPISNFRRRPATLPRRRSATSRARRFCRLLSAAARFI
jgi:fatty-acyl-CoA synthase